MAIRRPPAFQFYAADYLADEHVQLMTLEEEGVYIRLLAYCWREGSIPADPKALSRLCKGASQEAISVVSDRFEPLTNDGSRLTHPRLNAEREKQENWSKKNSLNGKSSGKVRRKKKLDAERSFNDRMNESRTKSNSSSSFSSSNTEDSLRSSSSAEAKQVRSAPSGKVAGTIPLNTGKQFPVFEEQVQGWTATYPAVDVRQELREIRAWCDSNPSRRKTERGVLKFVNSWLAREQDKGRNGDSGNGANRGNRPANERNQRSFDAIRQAADALGFAGASTVDGDNEGQPAESGDSFGDCAGVDGRLAENRGGVRCKAHGTGVGGVANRAEILAPA